MDGSTENINNTVNNTVNNTIKSITEMKDTTAVFLIIGVTLIIILILIIYYFYYSRLKSKQCSTMDAVYGDLNGKIRSIDNSEQFNYTFKDYYIKTAYNCCSGGNYKNDYVDTCILKDLLKQGVRGLDFEIFSIGEQPIVATSTSDSNYVKETFNYINFSDMKDKYYLTCTFIFLVIWFPLKTSSFSHKIKYNLFFCKKAKKF
jgi:hypothetical protein